MTTTNQCDLEEAKRLAIQKLVELSHESGWNETRWADHFVMQMSYEHKESGIRLDYYYYNFLLGLKNVYKMRIGKIEIGMEHYPDETRFKKGPIRESFDRIADRWDRIRDQTKCHEIMAALGRIKS